MMNNSVTRVVRGWKQDKTFCLIITLLAWFAGVLTSVPVIFNSTYIPPQNETHAVCGVKWVRILKIQHYEMISEGI
jgi:hypothetical protein